MCISVWLCRAKFMQKIHNIRYTLYYDWLFGNRIVAQVVFFQETQIQVARLIG